MEKWDLYDAKREKSGITVCRGEIIPKGLYHLSVSAWIVNQQGQYLLSQRHPKKQYPLYWECTGGSVLSGETSLQGAIREVKEELGILLTPGSEKLIYQTRRENVQDFYDVWLFHRDIKIEEMRLQETEVVDVQWVSSDKLFEMFRLKQLHPLITPSMNNRYFTYASKQPFDDFTLMAGVIALVLIGGYIVIQSIFRISINDKIRSYGQLRTIGATPKQIKRIVKNERRKLGSIGILIGTVLGVCGGFLLFSKGFNAVS